MGLGPLAGQQGGDEQRDIATPVRRRKFEHRPACVLRDDTSAHVLRPVRPADGLDQRERLDRHVELVAELDARGIDAPDVVLVTGDAYVDHPSFGMAVIGRVLEALKA